jgi:cytochrome d ubiquinol oxidase subunit II
LQLLSPQAVLSGVAFAALLAQHGAIYLTLKLHGELLQRTQAIAMKVGWPVLVLVTASVAWNIAATEMLVPLTGLAVLVGAGLIAGCLGFVRRFAKMERNAKAFAASGIAVVLTAAFVFVGLYPRVLPSTLNPAWNLTNASAAATSYTLRVVTIVAAICMPVVILYQIWAYHLLRGRIGLDDQLEY